MYTCILQRVGCAELYNSRKRIHGQLRGIVVHKNTIVENKTSNGLPVRDGQVKDQPLRYHQTYPKIIAVLHFTAEGIISKSENQGHGADAEILPGRKKQQRPTSTWKFSRFPSNGEYFWIIHFHGIHYKTIHSGVRPSVGNLLISVFSSKAQWISPQNWASPTKWRGICQWWHKPW